MVGRYDSSAFPEPKLHDTTIFDGGLQVRCTYDTGTLEDYVYNNNIDHISSTLHMCRGTLARDS